MDGIGEGYSTPARGAGQGMRVASSGRPTSTSASAVTGPNPSRSDSHAARSAVAVASRAWPATEFAERDDAAGMPVGMLLLAHRRRA